MGKALDWLTSDARATVAEQLLTVTQIRAGEIWAACPFHTESSPGNAFSYNPERDACCCNSCGAHGDLIAIFGAVRGMEPSEAFRQFRATHAPHVADQPRPVLRTPRGKAAPEASVTPAEPLLPSDIWQAKASALVATAHAALLANPTQMAWLAARGIKAASVHRHRLGWIPEALFRARDAWGLPPRTREDGRPKKLWIPAGLTIPLLDGETVLRVRIRQAEGEPKYLVLEGSAKAPAPLLCIADTWPGSFHACIVVEAELDAILVAQEVGDIAAVLAVGSASVLPEDTRSVAFCRSMSWFGLWLDRDAAGDKGLRRWTEATGEHVDGGFAQALDAGAADIRPSGEGKQDPGDCHAAGLSIRKHVCAALPRAWQSAGRLTASSGEGFQGGGGTPAAEQKSAEPAWSVRDFGRILAQAPLICRYADDCIWIKACKLDAHGQWLRSDAGELVHDLEWELTHWDLVREASRLFWHDPDVAEFLEQHPDAHLGISGRNYWAGMSRRNND